MFQITNKISDLLTFCLLLFFFASYLLYFASLRVPSRLIFSQPQPLFSSFINRYISKVLLIQHLIKKYKLLSTATKIFKIVLLIIIQE
jgi:hypothetical protein